MAEADRQFWSVSTFARALRKDKGTVSAMLEESGLEERKQGKGRMFPAVNGCRYLVASGSGEDVSPADRRNLAQAEKLECETKILQREWVPVDDYREALTAILGKLQKSIDGAGLDQKTRSALIRALKQS